MKIKTIDLLNMIANDKLPDGTQLLFKENNRKCIYQKKEKIFEYAHGTIKGFSFSKIDLAKLNGEVVILGNNPQKIEHIKSKENRNKKINEIIDVVNYLLEKS